MLKARLASEFPGAELRVLGAVDAAAIREAVSEFNPRVVISTVSLDIDLVPVVVVSPFLTTRDLRRVADVVYSRVDVTEADLLEACRASHRCGSGDQLETSAGPVLRDLVREDLIQVGVRAADAVEAITVAGELLRQSGIVTRSYVQAMVDIYRQLGPYMVVAPGVALPHAAPEDGALELGLGVVLLQEPVRFGSEHHDPVRVVIPLASPDYRSHMRVLMSLFRALHDGLAVSLREATCVDGIAALLRKVV
jgi:mannitol/fructose-specific phosphotransferase system IIA component (Ntr-type)